MDFLPSIETIKGLTGLVLGFGFVIFVHELGHYLVAKWVGIKVTQFAIGFGHSVLAWRKGIGFRMGSTEKEFNERIFEYASQNLDETLKLKEKTAADLTPQQLDTARAALGLGETEYRLNWMPLGGYVKMLGQEDMDPTATSDDPRSFNRKPIWARACVVSAGVVMNLIFAFIFLIIAFKAGVELPPAVVGDVAPTAPAAEVYAEGHEKDPAYLGLQPGDRIVSIDGEPVNDFSEIAVKVALAAPDAALRLKVERPTADGKTQELTFPVTPQLIKGETGKRTPKLLAIGVAPPSTLEMVAGNSAFLPPEVRAAGITMGMTLVEVNGKKVSRYYEFRQAVEAAGAEPIKLKFSRPNEAGVLEVSLPPQPALAGKPLLGLVPAVRIDTVVEGSPAQKAGIKEGDILARVGSAEWPSDSQARQAIQSAEGSIEVDVLRDGEVVKLGAIDPKKGKLGIDLGMGPTVISHTIAKSPVATLDLTGGSRITSVNGQNVETFYDLQRRLSEAARDLPEGGKITLGYVVRMKGNPSHTMAIDIQPDSAKSLAAAAWEPLLGEQYFIPESTRVSRDNLGDAAALGFKKTHQFMLQTYITLLRLTQGTVPVSEMRGPVGIAQEGTRIAQRGWPYLIFFLGVISINLVVINFLPMPIVDGGLMVLLIIEKIKGSPVGPRTLTVVNIVGLALIGCVFLTVTFFDVMRFFQG